MMVELSVYPVRLLFRANDVFLVDSSFLSPLFWPKPPFEPKQPLSISILIKYSRNFYKSPNV